MRKRRIDLVQAVRRLENAERWAPISYIMRTMIAMSNLIPPFIFVVL